MGYACKAVMHVLENRREWVTSSFGWRKLNGADNYHSGIDLIDEVSQQDYIIAAERGKVVGIGSGVKGFLQGSAGNYITLQHGGKKQTFYCHLKYATLLVKLGDIVSKGQRLAYMNSSGWSYGDHLHFGVKENGVYVNPLPYLRGTKTLEPYGGNGYVGTPVARDSERRQLEVKFTNLNARTGAGTDNSVLGTISPGIYNIEGSSENVYTWYEVSDANSKRYFIADVGGSVVLLSYIEYVGTPDGEDKTVDQVFINYEKLRARTSSGTSGGVAGYINRGFYDVDAASKEHADGYDWYLLNGKYRVAIVQGSSEFIKATLKLYDIIVKGASAGDKNTIVTQAEKLGLEVEVREL